MTQVMTNDMVEKLLAAGTEVNLPSRGLQHLLQALSSDDIDIDKLVAVLKQYPGITARLLSVANSAWSSPVAPITSLHSACTHLGLRLIRSISVSVAVAQPFNTLRCPEFDSVRFWSDSLLVADCSDCLATHCQHLRSLDSGTLHTAGLLHNVGMLWIADRCPELLQAVLELARRENVSVSKLLEKTVGMNTGRLTARLLEAMGLPDALTTIIAEHKEPDAAGSGHEASTLLGCASDLVALLRAGENCPAEIPSLERMHISAKVSQSVFDEMRAKADQVRDMAVALNQR